LVCLHGIRLQVHVSPCTPMNNTQNVNRMFSTIANSIADISIHFDQLQFF
jgi:DNA repair photolyase